MPLASEALLSAAEWLAVKLRRVHRPEHIVEGMCECDCSLCTVPVRGDDDICVCSDCDAPRCGLHRSP